MIFSKSFDTVHSKDTGLYLLKSAGSSLLNNGIRLAIFNSSGKTPSCRDKLHIYVKGVDIASKDSFDIELLMLSYPGAEDLKELIVLSFQIQ